MVYEREERRLTGVGVLATAIVAAVFLLYPMSVGPVALLLKLGVIPASAEPVVRALYAPLSWLGDRSSLLTAFVRWYLELWGA
jgi:hypothetical protein